MANGPTTSQVPCTRIYSGTRSSRFFTRTGIISPVKLILLSGHAEEKSLAIQCDLAQADVAEEHQKAMRVFPVRGAPLLFPSQRPLRHLI
jgi:hypothetical protein